MKRGSRVRSFFLSFFLFITDTLKLTSLLSLEFGTSLESLVYPSYLLPFTFYLCLARFVGAVAYYYYVPRQLPLYCCFPSRSSLLTLLIATRALSLSLSHLYSCHLSIYRYRWLAKERFPHFPLSSLFNTGTAAQFFLATPCASFSASLRLPRPCCWLLGPVS